MSANESNWKLKYKYGINKTSYNHYTVLARGVGKNIEKGFNCPDGNAVMAMKIWSTTYEEAADVFQSIGTQIGFTTTGDIEIFDSEPEEPPQENPSGYNINFTPFK